MNKPIVVALTGASGAVYAVRLIQQLLRANCSIHCVISPSAQAVLKQELDLVYDPKSLSIDSLIGYRWRGLEERWGAAMKLQDLPAGQLTVHRNDDLMSPIASGSFITAGMVICPCSGTTLSGIVRAASNNLIQRAADVHLKEHRKLIVVPRETPMSVFQIENMQRAAQAGAIVLPAMPGWYHGVESIIDLVDFVVSRILDHLDIPNKIINRWGSNSG